MEKKNTMLLTVIAVATLLVAVVGATFAYFSLTVGGSTSATTVTAKTDKIGLLTASGGTQALKLNLSAADMSQAALTANSGNAINYFATTNGTPNSSVTLGEDGNPTSDDVYTTIGSLTLSEAGKSVKYHCQGQYTVTVDVKKADKTELDDDTDKNAIKDTDGKLYLKTKEVSGVKVEIKSDSSGSPAESGVETINHDIKSLLSNNTKFWVTYDFETKSDNQSIEGSILAAFEITNRKDESEAGSGNQNYLANKQITVTLTPSDDENTKLKCDIVNE